MTPSCRVEVLIVIFKFSLGQTLSVCLWYKVFTLVIKYLNSGSNQPFVTFIFTKFILLDPLFNCFLQLYTVGIFKSQQ
ncbi:hypothetical protein BY996DRAFT_7109636 [Phakopsora pachyrhizi]|nr:hypothetical protein BY996DRAFT_7109636 [Phakopsora pachyrhizi]